LETAFNSFDVKKTKSQESNACINSFRCCHNCLLDTVIKVENYCFPPFSVFVFIKKINKKIRTYPSLSLTPLSGNGPQQHEVRSEEEWELSFF